MAQLARTEISARIVFFGGERILLASRRGERWYFLPGGQISPGETIEDALRRETDAETGLDITRMEFVGCTEHTYTEEGVLIHELNVIFAAPLPWAAQIGSRHPELLVSSVDLGELNDLDLRPRALAEVILGWSRGRLPSWHTTLPVS
ncbi:MAG: NUDIX domain-containing protein [Frankia sp.]|nr:NUDIX domain-containing protein [Frankia sp.]